MQRLPARGTSDLHHWSQTSRNSTQKSEERIQVGSGPFWWGFRRTQGPLVLLDPLEGVFFGRALHSASSVGVASWGPADPGPGG